MLRLIIESLNVTSQKLKVAKLWDMMRHSERASGKMPACTRKLSLLHSFNLHNVLICSHDIVNSLCWNNSFLFSIP